MAVLEVSTGRLRESFYNSIWLENKTVIFKVIAYEKVNSSPIFPSLVFTRYAKTTRFTLGEIFILF